MPIRYEERLLGFGCLRTKSYTSALFLDHICYAYTLKQLNYSWKSYMKGFVEVIQETDLCLTGPSLRNIDGQICREKHKSM